MPDSPFTLAMAQMLVEGGNPDANLSRAVERIAQAADSGASIVVLPECLDLGWTHGSALTLAQPIPGPRSQILAEAARKHQIHVAAGLTEKAGDLIYNAALLIDPQGQTLLHHRKINELTVGQHLYATGDRLAVAQTPLTTIGLNICADNFTHSLAISHVQARMGARLIVSPCAWATDADRDPVTNPYGDIWVDSYTTLAKLYDLYIVGVSCVGPITDGPWAGRICAGNSLAVGPGGTILAKGPHGPEADELMLVEIKPQPLNTRGTDFAEHLKQRGYRGH